MSTDYQHPPVLSLQAALLRALICEADPATVRRCLAGLAPLLDDLAMSPEDDEDAAAWLADLMDSPESGRDG